MRALGTWTVRFTQHMQCRHVAHSYPHQMMLTPSPVHPCCRRVQDNYLQGSLPAQYADMAKLSSL